MKSISGNKQSGAVSLFVVVFAMLLITVVTVSFLRLMVGDLRQASNNDLSQSAYDSAMAGTEDAKRALLKYQQYCIDNPGRACRDYGNNVISSSQCNYALVRTAVIGSGDIGEATSGDTGEIKVQQSTVDGNTFQQAYTCVTINLNTPNVEGKLESGESKIIPLRGESNFNRVQISWYSRDDLSSPSATIDRPAEVSALPLPNQATGWPATRPPIMRAQFVQYGSEFTLDNFDKTEGGASNANTVFMYPTRGGAASNNLIGVDSRRTTTSATPAADSPSHSPLPTQCVASVSSGGYACKMILVLPNPISGNASNRTAYLRLTPFYKAAHFEVRLFNSADLNEVNFEGVQPLIDSTGRANDLFRRVQSRVEMTDTTFPYPDAAVDVTTEFCKDFTVINTAPLIEGTCRYN